MRNRSFTCYLHYFLFVYCYIKFDQKNSFHLLYRCVRNNSNFFFLYTNLCSGYYLNYFVRLHRYFIWISQELLRDGLKSPLINLITITLKHSPKWLNKYKFLFTVSWDFTFPLKSYNVPLPLDSDGIIFQEKQTPPIYRHTSIIKTPWGIVGMQLQLDSIPMLMHHTRMMRVRENFSIRFSICSD